jgi:hypothetical protein
MVEPAPGSTPIRKPITDPLAKAKRQSFMSRMLGSRLRRPLGTGSSCPCPRTSMQASTSPMANTPMATTTKSMPESSSSWPKTKREVVLKRSVPMPESHRPTSMASSAFTIERPASSTTIARPSAIRAKYSGELNASAMRASGGATSISPSTPTVPAMNDAMAAMPSAGPARPLRAIWWPSMQVTTEADSPGTLSRMAVVEPPYLAP